MTADLTLVVIGKDQAALESFDRSHVDSGDLRLIANTAGRALAAIANEEMQTSRPLFGLVHADAVFGRGALEAFVADARAGAVCGIVGRDADGCYRWCYHRPEFAEGIVRGAGPVVTLDGCAVFFRMGRGLSFDAETFDSYHCHAEDLCMQAHARGIPVLVSSAAATHASQLPTAQWRAAYAPYRERLERKWQGHQVMTT